ncbi:putative asparagine--tRNA ligase [Schistosoma japonicum]|uniref:Putative asparagine--tRNA ligase n=1 Tax=Schistosoma japonicum TaxID=6182 RepID=A0A4Z2CQ44_SCHJA|nr:putative asparagine--tRNA ligase [Schistosoma japonicum]
MLIHRKFILSKLFHCNYSNFNFVVTNLQHRKYFPNVQCRSCHSINEKNIRSILLSLNTRKSIENEVMYKNVKLIGWVQSVRKHKSRVFCNISDGSSPFDLQVVIFPSETTEKITVGCALLVQGDIYPIPDNLKTSQLSIDKPSFQCPGELHAKSVTILDNEKQPEEFTFKNLVNNVSLPITHDVPTKNQMTSSVGRHGPRPDPGVLRSTEGLSMRHRLPEFGAMLRMRAHVKQLVRRVMSDCDYLEVDTPILTSTDCEGTGQMFKVQAPLSDETGKPGGSSIFLTGSAQMHLESLALGLSKVYTLNPTFRAENSNTRYHLAEFYMLEAESVYLDSIDTLCTEIEMLIKKVLSQCLEIYPIPGNNELNALQHDLVLIRTFLGSRSESGSHCTNASIDCALEMRDVLESMLRQPFIRISYDEAIEHLNKKMNKTDLTSSEIQDLSKKDEHRILDWVGGNRPVFITHFPIKLKPFYCQSIDGTKAECTDLLFPGIGELVGASVRESCPSLLKSHMKSSDYFTNHSQWYIDLRNTGGAPHSGFGLGFERLLQFLLGITNIRDTIAFPRSAYKVVF